MLDPDVSVAVAAERNMLASRNHHVARLFHADAAKEALSKFRFRHLLDGSDGSLGLRGSHVLEQVIFNFDFRRLGPPFGLIRLSGVELAQLEGGLGLADLLRVFLIIQDLGILKQVILS